VFAGLLIEDYVRTLISFSESRGFGIGIAKGRRSRAPYQVAVLIGLEDVEGGNQLQLCFGNLNFKLPHANDTTIAFLGMHLVWFRLKNKRTTTGPSGLRLLRSITPRYVP